MPLAAETAGRLTALGHDVMVSPLLEPVARDWQPPDAAIDALIFTSPQGPAFAGGQAARYRGLPAYAVGARTARAAEAAGFTDVREAGGDVRTLLAAVAAAGHAQVLHLAGAQRTVAAVPAPLRIVVRAVYEAELAPLGAAAQAALRDGRIDWALLFSTRSAAHFASRIDALGADRATLSIAVISPAALAAAGGGWRAAVAAATPSEAGILAASGLSCDKAPA
ncbi:MAG: uroporphyrinogen-III synthase [Sphingomonadaceae bacterium]|nr:uroporphyrinogen-III synthase [Sphingomonadaceae bacterium]